MNIDILKFYIDCCKMANVTPTFKVLKEVNRVWKNEFKLK